MTINSQTYTNTGEDMALVRVTILLICSTQLLMGTDFGDFNPGDFDMGDFNPGDIDMGDFNPGDIDMGDFGDMVDDTFKDLMNQFDNIDFGSISDDMKNIWDNALDSLSDTFTEDELNQIKAEIDSGSFNADSLNSYTNEQKEALSKMMTNSLNTGGEHPDSGMFHVRVSVAALCSVLVWNILL